MAWIKRNLFFVVGGILALGFLGWAGYYNYQGWSHNQSALSRLTEIQKNIGDLTRKKPSPGNDKIDNIKAAKDQERELQDWIRQAERHFKPIAPIPDTGTNAVSSAEFAGTLRRTIEQMQREAEAASVSVPPKYTFAFTVQTTLVKFDTGNLGLVAEQLGEVKAIAGILFAARVNALDGIQRVRVSADDTTASAADYFDGRSETNSLAVLTPYQITFRSFTPEVADVLSRFAASRHGFVVKSVNIQSAGAFAATTVPGGGGEGGAPGPMGGPPPPPMLAPPPPGKGGLQTVLNEQLLRVTLTVEVVKLLPKK
jgi:hypothetical protein